MPFAYDMCSGLDLIGPGGNHPVVILALRTEIVVVMIRQTTGKNYEGDK
jgi:hypothetical protein